MKESAAAAKIERGVRRAEEAERKAAALKAELDAEHAAAAAAAAARMEQRSLQAEAQAAAHAQARSKTLPPWDSDRGGLSHSDCCAGAPAGDGVPGQAAGQPQGAVAPHRRGGRGGQGGGGAGPGGSSRGEGCGACSSNTGWRTAFPQPFE